MNKRDKSSNKPLKKLKQSIILSMLTICFKTQINPGPLDWLIGNKGNTKVTTQEMERALKAVEQAEKIMKDEDRAAQKLELDQQSEASGTDNVLSPSNKLETCCFSPQSPEEGGWDLDLGDDLETSELETDQPQEEYSNYTNEWAAELLGNVRYSAEYKAENCIPSKFILDNGIKKDENNISFEYLALIDPKHLDVPGEPKQLIIQYLTNPQKESEYEEYDDLYTDLTTDTGTLIGHIFIYQGRCLKITKIENIDGLLMVSWAKDDGSFVDAQQKLEWDKFLRQISDKSNQISQNGRAAAQIISQKLSSMPIQIIVALIQSALFSAKVSAQFTYEFVKELYRIQMQKQWHKNAVF